jgi:hypothetical protein
MQGKLLEIINVDFDATGQLLIIHSAFVKYLEKWENNEAVHHLFINFKKAYDSVWRKVVYTIPVRLGISVKLVRPIRIYLNETYSRVRVSEHFTDTFAIMNSLKKRRCFIAIVFQLCFKVCL